MKRFSSYIGLWTLLVSLLFTTQTLFALTVDDLAYHEFSILTGEEVILSPESWDDGSSKYYAWVWKNGEDGIWVELENLNDGSGTYKFTSPCSLPQKKDNFKFDSMNF